MYASSFQYRLSIINRLPAWYTVSFQSPVTKELAPNKIWTCNTQKGKKYKRRDGSAHKPCDLKVIQTNLQEIQTRPKRGKSTSSPNNVASK